MAARKHAIVSLGLFLGLGFALPAIRVSAEPTPPLLANNLEAGPLDSLDKENVENRKIRRDGTIEETHNVTVGVQEILDFDFGPRRGVPGSAKILAAALNESNPKQVIVTPLAPGTTSLTITDVQGRVRYKYTYNVTANDMSQKVMAIRELLKDIEGISIRVVDSHVVLDGELIVPRDYDRILKVTEAYKSDGILDLVSISRLSMEAIAKRMQEEINKEPGGVNVQVKLANETFFLLGTVDNVADKDRAELISKTYLPDKMASKAVGEQALQTLAARDRPPIQNLIIINEGPPEPAKKMVRVTVHFVEIGKEFLKSSFFKWAPLMTEGSGLKFGQSTTGGVTTSGGGSFAGTISSLLPKLQSGSNGGFARVLYSTVGLGVEGTKIDLSRHNDVPYLITTNGVPNSATAQVGVHIEVTPSISGEDKVQMENKISVNTLAGAGGSSAPLQQQNSVLSNNLIVRSGESAVMGGMVSNDTAKDVDKDPEAAGSGNPLFTLLRSKAFRNKKTQFVIFITPKIVTDAAAETVDIKSKIINNNKQRKRTLK